MSAIGVNFTIDMTWGRLILLSLSEKRHNKPMLDEALEADSVTVLLRLLNITPETYEECT